MQTNCFGGSLHFVWLLSLASRSPSFASLPILSVGFMAVIFFSAGKVKCCLLPVRSEGAQGYSAAPLPPPYFVATMLLAVSSPAMPQASSGSSGSRPGCRGMRLSPVVSSLLSCSRLLQVDLFSTRHTERGPVFLLDSSRDQFTMFTVKRNDK